MKTIVALFLFAGAAKATTSLEKDLCILQVRNFASLKAKHDDGGEPRLYLELATKNNFANVDTEFEENLHTRVKIRRLTDQIRAATLRVYPKMSEELIRLHQEAEALKATPTFQKLRKQSFLPSDQGFDSAVKISAGNFKLEEIAANIAPTAKIRRKSAKFHDYIRAGNDVSSLAAEFISAMGTTKEGLAEIQQNCGKNLSVEDARFLGHYIDDHDGACRFSVTGANSLGTATDKELTSVCERFPAFGKTAEFINEKWNETLSNRPAPSDYQLKCKAGKVESLGYDMEPQKRNYVLENTASEMKITVTEIDKKSSFQYRANYLIDQNIFGSVHLNNVNGIKNREGKEFKKFHDANEGLPTKEVDRRRYDVGESLIFFEGIFPEAARFCASQKP